MLESKVVMKKLSFASSELLDRVSKKSDTGQETGSTENMRTSWVLQQGINFNTAAIFGSSNALLPSSVVAINYARGLIFIISTCFRVSNALYCPLPWFHAMTGFCEGIRVFHLILLSNLNCPPISSLTKFRFTENDMKLRWNQEWPIRGEVLD